MHCRLIVRGALPPDKRGTTDVKHRIRRELHPQLRNFWQQHPALRDHFNSPSSDMLRLKALAARKLRPGGQSPDVPPAQSRLEEIATEFTRWGYRFAPLVREAAHMACSLDILILRRDEPHRVFSGMGDLDNRVKVLLDGLRMPRQSGELDEQQPSADEDPFFCLLEDDKLIYDFTVTTDRLLVPPEPNEAHRDVVAVIGVKVTLPGGDPIAYMTGEI